MNTKTCQQREWELNRLANTHQGCEIIRRTWEAANGLPLGTSIPGTLVRAEMIPGILEHEYPNG
jgi:hypothetical protein